MKVDSICKQLCVSFLTKSKDVRIEIKDSESEYWREVTGGELMSDSFAFDMAFVVMHDKNYSKLEATLKKMIHLVNAY